MSDGTNQEGQMQPGDQDKGFLIGRIRACQKLFNLPQSRISDLSARELSELRQLAEDLESRFPAED